MNNGKAPVTTPLVLSTNGKLTFETNYICGAYPGQFSPHTILMDIILISKAVPGGPIIVPFQLVKLLSSPIFQIYLVKTCGIFLPTFVETV